MAKYLSKFVPNMSKITAPLRELTRQNVCFDWVDEHETSFTQLKHLLTQAPVLSYFDPSKSIEIETDSSKDGLGACLLQDGHPIAFASRSLNTTEQKYAQIEKEMLAIVFAVQKFHFFIYGLKNVRINSDHKPLEVIFKKDLASISPRLQRMRLRLLNYDLCVVYKPGKYLYIADTLSRAFLCEKGQKSDREFNFAVHSVIKNIPMSDERKTQFRNETKNDPQLQVIADYCVNGWPNNKHTLCEFAKHFFKIKDSLTFADGLLLFCDKVVVPYSLRHEMLKLLHEGHIGIEKSKARARQVFYWPGLNEDIETFNKKCKICESNARRQQKESLMLYPIAERPWERLGLDIFSYGDKCYLVIFDSFSNWLEVSRLKDKSSSSIIKALKKVFCVFGSPDMISCDNVPFNSLYFREFAKEWNFKILFRSPNYPRSNGLAEKGVDIGKKIVKNALKGNGDIEISLLQYRNSPLKHIGYSPSQLLMSRICKTKIPISSDLLKPKLCENVQDKLKNRHNVYNKYYNRSARDLQPLEANTDVTVYNHVQKEWEPGRIVTEHNSPRSYLVENQFGDTVRRNRVDLRRSLNEFNPTSGECDDAQVVLDATDTCNSDNSHDESGRHSNHSQRPEVT
ncbi:unnamed protein product [Callosobruchus maculatus]|uniref:RNA-directed DNA polymerase n=1 Tax=Callosobruchus maculatus TaxID=64391 RepID=A0A653D0T8_CALMS|nr:unnamed protein product [Callosobruchus maculatus]